MPNLNFSEIPIVDNIDSLSISQLEHLKMFGMCYIKLENSHFFDPYSKIIHQAWSLFRSSDAEKKSHCMLASEDEVAKIVSDGYVDRRSDMSHFEIFRQRVGLKLNSPFESFTNEIDSIKKTLVDELALKLLHKIFKSFTLNEKNVENLNSMFANPQSILQMTYYPSQNTFQRIFSRPAFHPHKDIDLITVLMIEKQGLQFWADGTWMDILPKEGYCVAFLGNELNAITKGRTRACLHRVRMTENEERLSTVIFVAPKKDNPIYSLDGEMLADTALSHVKKVNDLAIECKSSAYSAFSRFRVKMNVANIILMSAIIAKNLFSKNSSLVNLEQSDVNSLFIFSVTSFILVNSSVQAFRMTYFERMLMDYLQYPDCPKYASESQSTAYKLGQSSLNFFGVVRSYSDKSVSDNQSLWNAGLMRSFVGK